MEAGKGKEENVTFYDVDALPLRGVLLWVVGGGKIAPIRFFDPGSTLASRGHT